MNKRFVGVLTFAFLVAAGASLVLYRVLINRPATTTASPALAQLALATKDLEVGTVLKEGDVKIADRPGAIPPGEGSLGGDRIERRGGKKRVPAGRPPAGPHNTDKSHPGPRRHPRHLRQG